ncbi:MAG TPA: response regulator transcription factor [Sphingobacteriaceae bacterium]|nr:response regulator transcription factor [Sphingobacteriaceae bacterium]
MITSKNTILVVDDEADIRELIEYNLKRDGYEVITAENGVEAIEQAKKHFPQLILLDIMMPEMDGIEACRVIRSLPEFKDTFIVFLTARGEEYSEVSGFNVGADDYIAKPVKPRILMSRIAALLRRNKQDEERSERLEIADIIIDREAYLVFRGEEKIILAKKEFELLYLLASRPGKVFDRDQILKSVWEDSVIVTNRTIDVHIRKLREKLGNGYIGTVKGVGYKFEL